MKSKKKRAGNKDYLVLQSEDFSVIVRGFMHCKISTVYSTNNAVEMISPCVDCHFQKSVKLENELEKLSAY